MKIIKIFEKIGEGRLIWYRCRVRIGKKYQTRTLPKELVLELLAQ